MINPNPSPKCLACDDTKVVSQGGHDTGCNACYVSPQTLPAPGEVEVEAVVASECSYCGLVTTANLPDIEAEGERVAADTWKHPNGMYLWTDMLGAIQTAIADERARHSPLATVAAANDEGVAEAYEAAAQIADAYSRGPHAQRWHGENIAAAIRLLSQGGGRA